MVEDYKSILKQYWGYDSFRGIQEEIIRSVGSGRDTLGLMPTGGGKSVTFQVPALAMEGLCLVVSPLIALMKDQVQNLKRRGIKAAAVYSGMSREEIATALDNCIFGGYKLLYISPERLTSEIFLTKLRSMHISMITVDEAHCISQWGYDFRPPYLKIAEIRTFAPGAPVLAVTATATEKVVDDIQEKLGFKEKNVFRMSFERENLTYMVRYPDNKELKILDILSKTAGSAIVYTRSREKTRTLAEAVSKGGISCTFFHAGLTRDEKDKRQKDWAADKVRVMVATNAFGMGIDKPDVRTVIHADVPDSIEEYFQEAGRAGRDGKRAYAVLLWNDTDKVQFQRRVTRNFPEKEYIRKVYEDIQYYYQMAMGDGRGCSFPFDIADFCTKFHHFSQTAESALHILDNAGHLEYIEEDGGTSRVMFIARRDELYRMNEGSAECERVIRCLLRLYTGLFSEFTGINEDTMAQRCGLTRQQIYDTLVYLSKRRILHYIPGRKTPYIHYTHERHEASRISIPQNVYEDRMEALKARLKTMQHYATSRGECRSVMLLRYFGEKRVRSCGQCDYCRSRHETGLRRGEAEEISNMVMQALEENGKLSYPELQYKLLQYGDGCDKVIEYMIGEGMVNAEDGFLMPAGKGGEVRT